MIVIKLYGGLGNQLFQYGLGRSLSLYHNTELVMDTSWFGCSSMGKSTQRDFELEQYNVVARLPSKLETFSFLLHRKNLSFLGNKIRSLRYTKECYLGIDATLDCFSPNAYLDGYWQNLCYLHRYSSYIRNDIRLKTPILEEDLFFADEIVKSNSVSIHVRRGDYISNVDSMRVHGVCGLDYYKRAIDLLASRYENLTFFVFSDDLPWARENLSFIKNVFFVGGASDKKCAHDIRLMSMCKHHIIANSTFSWWGAWLNDHVNKVVIAPSRWYADGRNVDELFPPHWLRV